MLVATDATLAGSVELVDKALGAFGGSVDADLRVKVHPLLDSRLVVEATGVTPAMITGRPIAELLAEADLMLYTYSAVAYDALACGVPPVFVRSETLVDLDQLEPFAELRWSARTPAELRAAVAEIRALEEPELRAWRERAQRARFDALNPVEPPCFDAFMD